MTRRQALLAAIAGLWALFALGLAPALAQAPAANTQRPFQVYILTWRGCEEICVAFRE